MSAPFDKAAFIAAAEKAGALEVYPVEIAGVGACWVRPLTWGDEMERFAAREALEAQGVEMSRKTLSAIRLALNLCDAQGQPIFSASDPQHIKILSSLSIDAVSDALVKAGSAGGHKVPKG